MSAILPYNPAATLAHNPIVPMPDNGNEAWRHHYFQQQIPMPSNQWQGTRGGQMSGMHDTDLGMFQQDSASYEQFSGASGTLLSPQMGYMPDASWGSDMEVATPSTAGFPGSVMDPYHSMHQRPPNHHLALPQHHQHVPSSAHSPQSSHSGISPHQHYAQPSDMRDERPGIIRSITAPEQRPHNDLADGAMIKRQGSEDDDEDFNPNDDPKPRGRKRQRIPHTAVERRYRENLNAHLDKLRQTVPALASKRTAGASKPGDGLGESVKPSKCEILNGAIEHINALGKENSSLKLEMKTLKARIEDMERWYGSQQGSGFAK